MLQRVGERKSPLPQLDRDSERRGTPAPDAKKILNYSPFYIQGESSMGELTGALIPQLERHCKCRICQDLRADREARERKQSAA